MLYVIGISEHEFVKVHTNSLCWVDENGNMQHKEHITKISYDISQNTATFYNNKSDAFSVLDELKEKSDDVVFESILENLFPEAPEEPKITVNDLNVYELKAKKVER